MEERRKAKYDKVRYNSLDEQIKKKCNKAKEEWVNEQCHQIERNQYRDSKYMHSKIKEVSGKKGGINASVANGIKSKEGTILMEKEDSLNRWSEYIEELYDDDRGEKPVISKNMDGPPIVEEEVTPAIKNMKHGKATGPDNIPVEIISGLGHVGAKMTTKLLNAIYDRGKIPEGLGKSIFIALPKTPGATECELHRTISLMSHFIKILLRVLLQRMRKSLRPEISKTQLSFVPGKGTRNAIFTLSVLMERSTEVERDLYPCFIDYSKASDKVRHEDLLVILEELDIDGKYL